MRGLHTLFVFCVLHSAALAAARGSRGSKWQTLSGEHPKVVARGGFSGLFPDSSYGAYDLALSTSLSDVLLWCDVQLTQDGTGICFPGSRMDNASNIAQVFKNRANTHLVGGVSVKGYFPVDFTIDELANVSLTQAVFSRTDRFDGNLFPIMTVEDVAKMKPPGLWLNIQNDMFFKQFNLSMRSYVLSVSRNVVVNYISSPDVGFLRGISQRFNQNITKLILRILEQDDLELSTNQTYGSILKNLASVKKFASGILVPKFLIWPQDNSGYLLPYTSVVDDAHKEGLEVFASEFANDNVISYNFSFSPVAEIEQFIDNGNFAVDGVLSDFPITPAEAIDCFSHIGRNSSGQASPLVISHDGASGDFPGCTDDAYRKAILDGADIIDCKVQMTKDAIPFCVGSINLLDSTNAAQSTFMNLVTTIPEINVADGICTFSLTWTQIQQNLKPQISSPYASVYRIYRNPASKISGNLLKLSEFLALAKNTSVSGVLINVENAAYLAEKQQLDVIGAVLGTLRSSGYNQTTKKVMIQSTNSSVLNKFKDQGNFELVYKIDEDIGGVSNSAMKDIQKFAHSTVIGKESIFPTSQLFTVGFTHVVKRLQSYNLSVYVQLFRNEFVSQAWDFFSDSIVEINSYVMVAGIDGVITDFPKTAASYKKNRCLGLGKDTPVYMNPIQPGGLLQVMTPELLPPAEAPLPDLSDTDVIEPPMSPMAAAAPPSSGTNSSIARAPTTPPSAQPKITASPLPLGLVMLLAMIFLF